MARTVVIGGGFGGIASAARLAKLGHQVTLVERSAGLGGALGVLEQDGFGWDTGPAATLLPGVVRDLFRKSGRPIEREFDLVQQEIIRTHHFDDGTSLDLPGSSRAAQHEAVERLGPGLGDQWCDYVASFAEDWDVLRREFLERPWVPELATKETRARIFTREVLGRRLKRAFRDDRLRTLAAHPHVFDGHDIRDVPAWMGMVSYVEQRFGAWTSLHGPFGDLAEVLTRRLATRKVEVLLETDVEDIVVRQGRAVAVATSAGKIDAEVVVCAIDPRRVPTLADHVRRTLPALPPVAVHLGLVGDDLPDLPAESVFHGDPTLVVRTGGRAPDGAQAWTVLGRGLLSEDIVVALARRKVDVRERIEVRVDRSPRDQVDIWGSSPLGVLWQGRNTLRDRLSTSTPIPGVYAAGAHATPGAGIPFVGLSGALVAQEVGPAR